MENNKYNGWTNYETWNCKLWMDNDQGSQEYWAERAQEAYDMAEADKHSTREENACYELSKELENFFDENCPEVTGFYADILNSALKEVDWYEIAEALVEDEVEKEELVK